MQQSSPANGASTQAEQHLRAQLELLQKHDTDSSSVSAASSSRESRGPASRPPNGFDVLASPAPDAPRLAPAKSEPEAHIHPDLRAPSGHAPIPNMMPMAPPPSGHSPGATVPGPSIAPLAPAPPPPSSIALDDGNPIDGRKAKRELSQSKRAAQNRAAQRAFRQRKEGYIKKLEQQVRDYAEMERAFEAMRSEHYALRDYIIELQSKLLSSQGDIPPPPPNINLSHSSSAPVHSTSAAEPPTSNPGVGTPLEAVAQAVAGLAAQEQIERHQSYPSPPFKQQQQQQQQQQSEEDTRTTEEINRQLNPEEPSGQA
ncbi:Putative transcription factor kapC [Cladobotryum mycophilum]|uniref:Putative transcription factor kapC n=1 Tax=Cladobotryum mycophilum TaxID=491253 RepID=A0ABR0T1V1_9HYPO